MKIVMLCQEGTSTNIVYNRISEKFDIAAVIVENDVPRATFLKKRIKKLGFFKVIGQIAFVVFIKPLVKLTSRARYNEIVNKFNLNLDDSFLNDNKCIFVDSVNSDDCIENLRQLNPDVVIVNGTRIISEKVLSCVNARFINMHVGITPRYRGIEGAYWALCNKDYDNVGVTIHFVDAGIDTGNIIYQPRIPYTDKDSIATYSLLQTAIGVEYEIKAIEDIKSDSIKLISNNLPSELYSHPTLLQYLYYRFFKKVK